MRNACGLRLLMAALCPWGAYGGDVPMTVSGWPGTTEVVYKAPSVAGQWGTSLSIKTAVKAGRLYRLVWKAKEAKLSNSKLNLTVKPPAGAAYGESYALETTFHPYLLHYHAQRSGELEFIAHAPPGNSGLELRDLGFEELDAAAWDKDVFPSEAFATPGLWLRGTPILVKSDFLGEAMALKLSDGLNSPPWSPVEPGKPYVLSFWAKADAPTQVDATLDTYRPGHKGEHWWVGKSFRLSREWREYRVETTIPRPERIPDMVDRMARVTLHPKDKAASIYIGHITFIKRQGE